MLRLLRKHRIRFSPAAQTVKALRVANKSKEINKTSKAQTWKKKKIKSWGRSKESTAKTHTKIYIYTKSSAAPWILLNLDENCFEAKKTHEPWTTSLKAICLLSVSTRDLWALLRSQRKSSSKLKSLKNGFQERTKTWVKLVSVSKQNSITQQFWFDTYAKFQVIFFQLVLIHCFFQFWFWSSFWSCFWLVLHAFFSVICSISKEFCSKYF